MQHIPNTVNMPLKDPRAIDLLDKPSASREAIDNLTARGHDLIQKGQFVFYTNCRRRRKVGNNNFWTSVPCRGQDVDTISLGDSSSEEDEAGLVQEVSLAKKLKIVQQWKEKQNIIKKKANNFTRDEALCRRVQDLTSDRHKEDAGNSDKSMHMPFKVHRSHRAYYICGFVLCVLRHLWKHSGVWKQEPHARKRVQEKSATREAGCNEENAQWQKPTRCGSMA